MKKILMIVGSLRENSFNRRLAREIEELIDGRAEIIHIDIASFPFMNQDIEFPVPEAVQRAREEVMEADGIWICSPEYNHSIPGVLKNALDWLSRPMDTDRKTPSAIKGKPVTISCAAGRSRAGYVRAALKDFAETTSMKLVGGDGVGISLDAEAYRTDSRCLTEDERCALGEQIDVFLKSI